MSSETSRPWAKANLLWLVPVAIALWMVVIDWPEPVTDYLDASWQTALVHAHESGRSFGNGIIFSAGPLGFLNSHFFLPGSLEIKLWWETAGKLVLVGYLVAFAVTLPVVRRVLFLVAALALITIFPDTFFTLLLVIAVVQGLLAPDVPRWRMGIALVLIAFLAQLKFTHCLLAACGALLAASHRVLRRDLRGAALIGGGFVLAFLGCWLLAGQNPVRLPDYFRYSWQISSGYPWAMSFDETWPVFIAGAVVALACGAWAWQIWRHTAGPRLAALPLPLFLCAGWFLTWKHGFTRADGHVFGFFLYALLMAIALPALIPAGARRWWFEAIGPVSILGLWLAEPGILLQAPNGTKDRIRMSSYGLLHPAKVRVNFRTALEREKTAHDMPVLRQAVGTATVDLLNYEQGLLILNGLNYHPRPVPQSYSVYTQPLLRKNAGFFRRANAPEFVVVRMASIDGRLPMQDDSLVVADLPLRYDLAVVDGDNVVLKRKAAQPEQDPVRTKLLEKELDFGQELVLPPANDQSLWLEADFPTSWIGRGRSFLYKPPTITLVALDFRGQEYRFRIVPTIASTGFILQPLIQNSADYANFMRGTGSTFLKSIRFEPASANEREFWTRVSVRLFQMPQLPARPLDPMRGVLDAGISNLVPVSAKSDTNVLFISLAQGQRALLVHATGEVVFQPEPRHRQVKLEFGLSEGSYTNGGKTDGAEFAVECEKADGTRTVVWRQRLDPANRPEDRGSKRQTVALPAGTVRVRLQSLPGPSTNNNWDWTYWSQIGFEP